MLNCLIPKNLKASVNPTNHCLNSSSVWVGDGKKEGEERVGERAEDWFALTKGRTDKTKGLTGKIS